MYTNLAYPPSCLIYLLIFSDTKEEMETRGRRAASNRLAPTSDTRDADSTTPNKSTTESNSTNNELFSLLTNLLVMN